MSIKKSIVTRVTGNGTWDGNYGLMYKFEIEMENGDIGENLSKSQECKFKEGEETEYEFTEKNGYFKIKPVSNFQPRANYSTNGSDVQDNIRFAQGLNIANLQFCHGVITKDQINEVAYEMYEILKKGPQEKLPF
ncbi:MAG: hypothetical protein Unbinned3987contig1001_21 [Prokaryotic dsDNA virus sp.]|jgi:hypothetical protein|nr:MAG: hypothetical protein Unbinned3987contig1001_21 [Prokaryotic dsDNA virus sp.]|tara:strand:+ start:691 stop:1095 length:405 start_codon:yes stop_codon:yes gene_type:complete